MRVHAPAGPDANGRLAVTLEEGTKKDSFYFASRDFNLQPSGEALIASALFAAMQSGAALGLAGTISREFYETIGDIQDILAEWHPQLAKVGIEGCQPQPCSVAPAGRVGLFFSAGVDSFYSLLKHQDEITDLIFIRGHEFRARENELLDRNARIVHETARRMGKHVIEVETDLRWLLASKGLKWVKVTHGAVMAAIGLLLQGEFRRIYIAATGNYARLDPWPSHPMLDPMWGTEALEFVHDGCELNRVEKVAVLAREDWVLRSLRVCGEYTTTAPNCGRCEKCIRTMLNLLAAGALERGPQFEVGLDAQRIRRMRVSDFHRLEDEKDNLHALAQAGAPRAIIRALRSAIHRWERRFLLMRLARTLPSPLRLLLRLPYRLLRRLGLIERRPREAGEQAAEMQGAS